MFDIKELQIQLQVVVCHLHRNLFKRKPRKPVFQIAAFTFQPESFVFKPFYNIHDLVIMAVEKPMRIGVPDERTNHSGYTPSPG